MSVSQRALQAGTVRDLVKMCPAHKLREDRQHSTFNGHILTGDIGS